jgi:2-(1,2-epoxy-1,2-dihydrophenyl)acetyl-CoA isomerase
VSEALIDAGLVLVDLDDGVAHVRLNRPEASNGMNVPFLRALYEALMRVHGEARTRAVLLSGEGPHFCAGGDVHTFSAQGEALPDYLREATTWLGSCASAPPGGSVTLARIVGLRKAMEIALLNPTLSAAQALELGIVNRVVPDDAVMSEATALARQLSEGATRALAATKRLLWDGIGATVEARLPDESRTVSELSGTADAREGLAAVIEKRRPKFSGR